MDVTARQVVNTALETINNQLKEASPGQTWDLVHSLAVLLEYTGVKDD